MTREALASDPSGTLVSFIESYCLNAADYMPSKCTFPLYRKIEANSFPSEIERLWALSI